MALSPPHEASSVPDGLQLTNQHRESGCALSLWTRDRASFMSELLKCLLTHCPLPLTVNWHNDALLTTRTNKQCYCPEQESLFSFKRNWVGKGKMYLHQWPKYKSSQTQLHRKCRHLWLSGALREALWGVTSKHSSKSCLKVYSYFIYCLLFITFCTCTIAIMFSV